MRIRQEAWRTGHAASAYLISQMFATTIDVFAALVSDGAWIRLVRRDHHRPLGRFVMVPALVMAVAGVRLLRTGVEGRIDPVAALREQ